MAKRRKKKEKVREMGEEKFQGNERIEEECRRVELTSEELIREERRDEDKREEGGGKMRSGYDKKGDDKR